MGKPSINLIHSSLLNYSRLSCDEIGEATACLCECWGRSEYMSDKFKKSIEEEMRSFYKMFKERTKIVQRETDYSITIEELEWIS